MNDTINNFDRQVTNYRNNKQNEYLAFKRLANNEPVKCSEAPSVENKQIALWEKHSKGFGSKMLNKMGFGGKGLGKNGNGILQPVTITKKSKFNRDDKEAVNTVPDKTRVANYTHLWPIGTTLITGSSILLGIEENRLKSYKAKVRPFPGAMVDDMFDYLLPLLKKEPTNVILQIGSNDSPFKHYQEIADEIENLKAFIHSKLPSTRIFISCPVVRTDNKKANNTLRQLDTLLRNTTKDVVINDNVDISCLGKKGLHLNPKGYGRLATNFISLMRCF